MPAILTLFFTICRPVVLVRWLILLAALVAGFGMLNYGKVQVYFAAREKRNQTREAVETLKKQKDELERVQASLKTQGFAAEKAVRERLMMVRPGEKIIVIETPASGAPGEATGPQPIAEALGTSETLAMSTAADTTATTASRPRSHKKAESATAASAANAAESGQKATAQSGGKKPPKADDAVGTDRPSVKKHRHRAASDAKSQSGRSEQPN